MFAYRKGFVLSVCLFSEGEKPGLGCLTDLGRTLAYPRTSWLSLANYHVSLDLSFHFPTVEMATPSSQEDKMSSTGYQGSSPVPGSLQLPDEWAFPLSWFPFAFLRRKPGEGILIWLVTKNFRRTCFGTQGQQEKSKTQLFYSLWFSKYGPQPQAPGNLLEMQTLKPSPDLSIGNSGGEAQCFSQTSGWFEYMLTFKNHEFLHLDSQALLDLTIPWRAF